MTDDENGGQEAEETGPDPKKKKLVDENYRLNRVAEKIVQDSNALLALTVFEGKIDKSHVTVSFEPSGKISACIRCIICKQMKGISLNSTKYSACISNFKRHVTTVHFKKAPSNTKPIPQTTLDSFLNRPTASIEESSSDQSSAPVVFESEGE